jgi:CRISPR-associated exonuclease Cas4
MNDSTVIMVGVALTAILGIALLLTGRAMRRRRGLGHGRTVSLDKLTLTSLRLGLTGRPDRLIKADGTIIVEEWKSSRQLRPWHRAQMGVYFLLVEEELRIRPPYGFLVCGDGTRHQIDNTEELRNWVVELARQIRQARSKIGEPIPVDPKPGQCRPCGQRGNCSQARLPNFCAVNKRSSKD